MSLRKQSPPSPTPSKPATTHDLKQRVVTCLNKLSDRDTVPIAIVELESIARNLTQDSFSSFINCIYNTDSSCKSPVRRQCVSILTLISQSYGDMLSPFLSKMILIVIRRLRDSDSVVRSACVDAITAMSLNINKPPFSVFLNPLMETLTIEQDLNSQTGAAMCLSAAIEASTELEVDQLRKVLPRLGKLAKSEGFKAKPALLMLIGSFVGVGGAVSRVVLEWIVPCIVEFLGSEDWATRKAAAEALGKVAIAEVDLAREHKNLCLASLENRRFDKVKIVRETMNHTLELWKEVPEKMQEIVSPFHSKPSLTDNPTGKCFHYISKSTKDTGLDETPKPNKTAPASRCPPSVNSYQNTAKTGILEHPRPNNCCKSSTVVLSRLPRENPYDMKGGDSLDVACEDDITASGSGVLREKQNCRISTPEIKHVVISNACDEIKHKYPTSRSVYHVAPVCDDDIPELDVLVCSSSEEVSENYKEVEDLSLIRKQLVLIENQQLSLLNLLQRFMGSSQSGINSLESRVCGLEMALDEISYDLAISNGRIQNADSAENTCCRLPGTEFFSSTFWRRTQGPCSDLQFSSGRMQSRSNVFHTPDKCANLKTRKYDSQ